MAEWEGEEVAKVVALTLQSQFLSLYPVESRNPPPVGVGEYYYPVDVGEVGFLPLSEAHAARDAGHMLLFAEATPKQISDAVRVGSTDPFPAVQYGEGWSRPLIPQQSQARALSVQSGDAIWREFHFDGASVVQYPALIFPATPGVRYRVQGNLTVLEGTAPKLVQRLGFHTSPVFFELTATGAFDHQAICGSEVPTFRFSVTDRLSTTRAVIKDLYFEEVP